MEIIIDRPKCCGAGQCVMAAPEVFDQDEEGVAFLIAENAPYDDHLDAIREAIASCPTGAISISGD